MDWRKGDVYVIDSDTDDLRTVYALLQVCPNGVAVHVQIPGVNEYRRTTILLHVVHDVVYVRLAGVTAQQDTGML
jgi:hypothetical protein